MALAAASEEDDALAFGRGEDALASGEEDAIASGEEDALSSGEEDDAFASGEEDALASGEEEDLMEEDDSAEDEDVAPFSSKAYSRAFEKIMRKNATNESLGPVLAARKQLIASKLEEEEEEQKTRKSKLRKAHLEVREKGHVLPDKFSNAKEAALAKLATKGVVTLFNAVSKAQRMQAGSETLKTRDAKALMKQTKSAFISELRGEKQSGNYDDLQGLEDEKPGWSALKDDFMLGGSKLKDWDKNEASEDESEEFPMGSDSDD